MRADEIENPVRLGDAPPALPFRKPFDLTPAQLALLVVSVGTALGLDNFVQLSDEPFDPDGFVSPMILARLGIVWAGALLIFVRPCDRSIPGWLWAMLRHFYDSLGATFPGWHGEHGVRENDWSYFPADAEAMTRMQLHGESAVFIIEPPLWGVMKRLPMGLAESYWKKHAPYRLSIPVKPQGSLELMTDVERASGWHSLWAGLKAIQFPVEFVVQTLAEDIDWLVECAAPPKGSPFWRFRKPIEHWTRERASKLIQRRAVVTCSAPTLEDLVEHVRDVGIALAEAGLEVGESRWSEQQEMFSAVYGTKHFYPRATDSFGIDDEDWVTLVVRRFPRHCVVGWPNFVIGARRVDLGLYAEPDDGAWVTRIMEWFQGMCMLDTADTAHRDAAADLERVEAKLKRNEDTVMRTTLLMSMPKADAARVGNNLRKAGAEFHEARFEHNAGRMATLPRGGPPNVGITRPYDGAAVAGCFPFGAAGLRMGKVLLGTARGSPESVTLDLQSQALNAAMVAILGTTGAGKTFLMHMLLLRSGLPFVVIDMKPHLDEIRCGDFYRLVREAEGNYHVCKPGEPLPKPHPFAQAYNLAGVPDADKPAVLQAIAEQEWQRAVESAEDRIFAVDEAYWLGRTDAGQEFIERIVSQGRSVGFIGIVASQEIGDFLGSKRMAKAVTMSSVQIILAQEKGVIDGLARTLNLGGEASAELQRFQPAPENDHAGSTRSALMRVGQRMVSFRIEACQEETMLYTTKPSDKRARMALREGVAA